MTKTAKQPKPAMPKFPEFQYGAMDDGITFIYDTLDELAAETAEESPWVAVYRLERVARLKRTGATLED